MPFPQGLWNAEENPAPPPRVTRPGDDELDGEDPIEIKEVVGYKGAQHAFSEAIRLDPDGDVVPVLGDSHEKLLLQAQLGPIMEMGAR